MALPIEAPVAEDLLRQLQSPIRLASSVRVLCAAAGDYAAGDVMTSTATADQGQAVRVPNLARVPGGVAVIRSIRAVCSEDAVANNLRLHFFTEAPLVAEVEMDDNAPFSIITAAGAEKWVGSILLNAFVDRGTLAATSDNPDLLEAFVCHESDDGLYMVVVTEQIEANESADMTIRFEFYTQ